LSLASTRLTVMACHCPAVRELLRLGLAGVGRVADNSGTKSSEYGVLKAPERTTKERPAPK
jgi:hypothetical protein